MDCKSKVKSMLRKSCLDLDLTTNIAINNTVNLIIKIIFNLTETELYFILSLNGKPRNWRSLPLINTGNQAIHEIWRNWVPH